MDKLKKNANTMDKLKKNGNTMDQLRKTTILWINSIKKHRLALHFVARIFLRPWP